MALLVVAESPDNEPVDADVDRASYWQDENYGQAGEDTERVQVRGGLGVAATDAAARGRHARTRASTRDGQAYTYLNLRAGYSPSSTFIHVAQTTSGPAEGRRPALLQRRGHA